MSSNVSALSTGCYVGLGRTGAQSCSLYRRLSCNSPVLFQMKRLLWFDVLQQAATATVATSHPLQASAASSRVWDQGWRRRGDDDGFRCIACFKGLAWGLILFKRLFDQPRGFMVRLFEPTQQAACPRNIRFRDLSCLSCLRRPLPFSACDHVLHRSGHSSCHTAGAGIAASLH